ncbi:MAG: sigma-54 dependent transcriptional regulator [Colwellia sp.]|nr:sigma-54 dependent transcriptional regulator [Colwellia sp.]
MSLTILVIDDMADVRLSANFLLSNQNYNVLEADSVLRALDVIKENKVDLILLDMNYSSDTTSGQEGLNFLTKLAKFDITTPVIAMTGWSSIDLAVKAMQQGASDFIEKPWDNQRLLQIIKQQIQVTDLKQQNRRLRQHQQVKTTETLVWQSKAMTKLMAEIHRIAKTDATILLTGENGTGKSSIATYIHQLSTRSQQSMVTVNMGAIPESLFESELFGHKKGAFTDAKETRIGRFEMANEGTLFLDEIANIPLAQQAKLLRVLESNEYEMVGSSITEHTNVRLISASNASFDQLIQQEKFRADLFYRLNTIEIHIPSLRERTEDILPLAKHFVEKHAQRYGQSSLTLADDVAEKLKSYDWPGNIRELSHVIERAVLFADDNIITSQSITLKKRVGQNSDSKMPFMTLEQAEQQLLLQALKKTDGLTVEAAELLGISKSAIYRRMEKYDIKN